LARYDSPQAWQDALDRFMRGYVYDEPWAATHTVTGGVGCKIIHQPGVNYPGPDYIDVDGVVHQTERSGSYAVVCEDGEVVLGADSWVDLFQCWLRLRDGALRWEARGYPVGPVEWSEADAVRFQEDGCDAASPWTDHQHGDRQRVG